MHIHMIPGIRISGRITGKRLLEHVYKTAGNQGCKLINIGIVEENIRLRKWYEQNGAVHTGTKKFDFFPFTCGYMIKEL